ncbi:MAG: 5-(carboxyamino)imidazole ribonucleotide synthase [Bacteroidetes bacterium]|nr:5-(carboxyamino)imidazole ribonucleotide synthase [Bacteroidota bacterium]HET6245746.1 5-(carboxyamino)imidazole ribonucleotide synthase [Bacteroidia bacterium]
MKKSFYNNFRLGVLGGGQLGRMLIQEAINFNVQVVVLDPDEHAPCRNLASDFVKGDLQDFQTVYDFGKKVDLLTIEIEHVNVDALKKLEDEGLIVYPPPKVLEIVQDKGLQKEFYKNNNIPSAAFFLIENKNQIKDFALEFPFMQKLRKGGYDGRGVTRLTHFHELENAFDEPSVLEKLIDFEKEISVIIARNKTGETKCFPITELEFNPEFNLVEYLFAPADVSSSLEKEAYKIAEKIAVALDFVGILAVEMFVTKDQKVLVNEIAPRPHNSGHHTIEANYTSQYEQHLRAIFDLPLGSTKSLSTAVMVNLLGEKGFSGDAVYQGMNEVLATEGVSIHLYGKKSTRPFRKMGHVTILDADLIKAKEKAKWVKETLKIISE